MKAKKALIIIITKYAGLANFFSEKFATILPEHIEINIYTINLEKDKQPSYELIYSWELIELEILKTNIKTNLANGFICPSNSSIKALILFNQKLDWSFWLCVNYQGFNNLTTKNWYSFPFIGKFFE